MDATHSEPPTRRDSARVLLLDDADRVLLVEIDDEVGGLPRVWITPGGGIEPGETIAQAAVRELREETGVPTTIEALGEPVAFATGSWTYRSTPMVSVDWFFVLRTSAVALRDDGWTPLEREVHRGWRWWTPEELDATEEPIVPGGLAAIVVRLASGWRPTAGPVELEWVRVPTR